MQIKSAHTVTQLPEPGHFAVLSGDSGNTYLVRPMYKDGPDGCSCPASKHGHICKHVVAVRDHLRAQIKAARAVRKSGMDIRVAIIIDGEVVGDEGVSVAEFWQPHKMESALSVARRAAIRAGYCECQCESHDCERLSRPGTDYCDECYREPDGAPAH